MQGLLFKQEHLDKKNAKTALKAGPSGQEKAQTAQAGRRGYRVCTGGATAPWWGGCSCWPDVKGNSRP
eukprot:scaffold50300_cov18-Tisochrysis_lutea.AAC.1